MDSIARDLLAGKSGVSSRLVPIDIEPARHVGQQLGQLHGVPGPAAAARLLEGVGAPLVGLLQYTISS